MIFAKQTADEKKQRSLEYAMEHLQIPMNLPAHDALNDAYFTALVAKKLDMKDGLLHYNDNRTKYLSECVIGDADGGEDGYVTIGELLDDDIVKKPLCPICKSPLNLKLKPLHSKGQRYTYFYNCKKDGDIFLSLKLHRNFNETWRAKMTTEKVTEEQIVELRRALDISTARRKYKKRKARSFKKNDCKSQKTKDGNS